MAADLCTINGFPDNEGLIAMARECIAQAVRWKFDEEDTESTVSEEIICKLFEYSYNEP